MRSKTTAHPKRVYMYRHKVELLSLWVNRPGYFRYYAILIVAVKLKNDRRKYIVSTSQSMDI